jgi:zinc transport system substrate-binding protein
MAPKGKKSRAEWTFVVSIGSLLFSFIGVQPLIKARVTRLFLLIALSQAVFIFAEPLKVSVSIAPLHSLVAQLGQGVFEPDLIYPTYQSPHSAALKPSQLGQVLNADLLIWVDESFEQSLGKLIAQRPPAGVILQLHENANAVEYGHHLTLLDNRDSLFESSESHHDDKDDHAHDHDHGLIDPHFWLNPENAIEFSRVVYQQLVAIDGANTEIYSANLAKLEEGVKQLQASIVERTAAVQSVPFIVFHDGFQYFEHAFSLTGVGAVMLVPDQPPGPKTILQLIEAAKINKVECLFAEPQYDQKTLTLIKRNLTNARIGVKDTLGSAVDTGVGLYPILLEQLADGLVTCLEQSI